MKNSIFHILFHGSVLAKCFSRIFWFHRRDPMSNVVPHAESVSNRLIPCFTPLSASLIELIKLLYWLHWWLYDIFDASLSLECWFSTKHLAFYNTNLLYNRFEAKDAKLIRLRTNRWNLSSNSSFSFERLRAGIKSKYNFCNYQNFYGPKKWSFLVLTF